MKYKRVVIHGEHGGIVISVPECCHRPEGYNDERCMTSKKCPC